MFEDSTFESTGRIRTRSRIWMMVTFAFNAAILLALIFIPLIYPEALPRLGSIILMEAPPQPQPEPRPIVRPEHATVVPTQMPNGFIEAPSVIPKGWKISTGSEIVKGSNLMSMLPEGEGTGSPDNPFRGHEVHPVIVQAPKTTQHVSSGVMEGRLIFKVVPPYPPIAKVTHQQGTVVLQATISRKGTIENLRVASGPAMLQQAALDAVQQWRYRPYLLNGEPVEVETTVNVQFTLE